MRLDLTASECDHELHALHDFVQEWQREPGSIVQNTMKKLVLEYNRSVSVSAEKPPLSITVFVIDNKNKMFSVVVSMTSTLLDLKRRLESKSSVRTPISTFHITRSSTSYNASSVKTIQECDFKDGDKLTAGYSVSLHMGVQRIESSGIAANSSFQYMVLLLHAFMLDGGFQYVIDVKNARDDYHPVCKAMHEGEFLRPNWNADPCSIDLLYCFGDVCDQQVVLLSCEDLMGTIFVSLTERQSKRNRYMELPVYEYIDERRGSDQKLQFTVRQGKTLRWQLMRLVNAVVPQIDGCLWRPRSKGVDVDCSGMSIERTLALAEAHYAAVEAGHDDTYLERLIASHLSGEAQLLQEEQHHQLQEEQQNETEAKNQDRIQLQEQHQEQHQAPYEAELLSGTTWLPTVPYDPSDDSSKMSFPYDEYDTCSGMSSFPNDSSCSGEMLEQRLFLKQNVGSCDDSSVDISEYTASDTDEDSMVFEETVSRQLPHSPAGATQLPQNIPAKASVQLSGLPLAGTGEVTSVVASPQRSPTRRVRWVQALRNKIRGYS